MTNSHRIIVLTGIFFFMLSGAFAANKEKIQTAVNVVSELCLSGTEYGIEADLEGNITIKNFKPKGSGAVTLNVREANGATAFQDDLRIIADGKVRECTQNHIGRILSAVLEETEPQETVVQSNKSISRSKFLGSVPDDVSVFSSVEGEQHLYYRFSVKEPSNITIKFSKNSQPVTMYLTTKSERAITSGHFHNGKATSEHFLMPGDYYVNVSSMHKNSATAFKMVINGVPDN